ncbi:CYTH domain-containing protein [Dokdonella sp.]|uniref:CYTH domain-containing protein n=1 Tax=Dokdonella sp. TaxID=2291710 RepID=UPI001AFDB734|nr:CYTH domain-containing protein [Dokdonella sp.]MBO9663467.1 CYTH domain-containing protein [Dokdonella sp.]
MPIEIERKFLVVGDAWREKVSRSERMMQGYLAGPPAARCSVRVRIGGAAAFLNIKSATPGVQRDEYEYAIPTEDAQRLLRTLAGDVVEKVRHYVEVDGHTFEIDEFAGDNAGLIVAELELDRVDEPFPRPGWLGREVSELVRYYNLHLAAHPYSRWSDEERNADDAH